MALDCGTKRTGVAVTDELQIIASGLATVETKKLLPFLHTYFKTEIIECLVIGKPKQMDNSDSESEPFIQALIHSIRKEFPHLEINRVDERFTSKMAFQTMIASGLKKKKRQDKNLIDEISATLILQNYLEYKS